MHKSFRSLPFVLALATGCAVTDVDLAERPRFANGVNNLTVLLYDALTSAPVTDATVTVIVGANRITSTVQDNVYVVSQVPTGTFPIIIERNGYLTFSGSFNFNQNGTVGSTNPTYFSAALLMYPQQGVTDNYIVRIFDQETGDPVNTGKAVAILDNQPDFLIPDPNAGLSNINGSYGLVRRVLTVDIQNGVATFPAADLIYGAQYRLEFLSIKNAAGQFLDPQINNYSIWPGIELPELTIFTPLASPEPVARMVNNEEDGVFVPNLVVTFPYGVELCSKTEDHTWDNVYDSDDDTDGNIAGPPADPDEAQVTTAFSADNTQLTVSPIFGAAGDNLANDPDDSLTIRFYGIRLKVKGTSDGGCRDLDGDIQIRWTDWVSTQIDVREIVP